MSRVYDNTTFDTPWNYSQNELEPRIAKEQWQNVFSDGLATNHGVFRRDESISPPTGIQLRETKSKSKLCDDDDDIPEWTNTFFGTTFRRYSEEWKQMKSRWQLKYGQISPTYDPTTTKESKYDSFETSVDRIVPYMTHKNGTIESIENNRSRDSEWSNQYNDTKKKKEFKRKRCICFALITVITCLVLAACITSALLIHVLDTPKNKNSYVETKISATTTNQQYLEGMENASSKVFKDFEIQFCSAAQTKLDQTSNCKVESLRNGSIVLIFIIYIKTEKSEAEVKRLIMDKLIVKEDGKEQITLGIFVIKPDSFGVTETRTMSEESLPKNSINWPVDKETDYTKSSSSSMVSTKDGSSSFTLQSVTPITSFASTSDSSSNEIKSSAHVYLQESTIREEIHTTTNEESTPSLMLESDSLPYSTSPIVSSDTTSSIANTINVDSLIGPTSTVPASTIEPESSAQMAASNTEPTDTSYILSSTKDPPLNDYGYTSEVGSSSFELLTTTNAAPLTSTLYMEYVSTSLLESPSQAPVALTLTEPLPTESTQLFTTDIEEELQTSSISIDPTISIVEEMYSSNVTTSHLTDSLNSNIQPHTATTSKHQTIIEEVESSHVMNSYSIYSSLAMVEIVSSGQQMDDQSMITTQPYVTSEIPDLRYASSAVTNPYSTSADESPVAPTPSFAVGHVTSTDQQMDDESTDGMSDIRITAQPSTISEIPDLQSDSSSVTNPYITSTDESPVAATPSFAVEHVTSTDQQMDDESTDAMSDIRITALPSTISELSDLQSDSSSVTNPYITSTDESPVAATPSFAVEHVTSTDQQMDDESTEISSLQYASIYVTNSFITSHESSVAEMSFSATPSIPDGYVTSQALSDMSYVLVTDSFGSNLLESLDSPLETPSLAIDGSVTDPVNYFTSEIEVPSFNPSSSIADMSTSIPIPKPDVKATGETVYQDQGNLTFTCSVDNYHNFTSIILEFDDVVKFNITKDNDGIEDSEWSLVQKTLEDTLTLAATNDNPTCEDSNKTFRCSVYGDWGVVDDSASSVVKVKPGTPYINLPIKFIENEDTLGDIYCSVDRGIPAATVSWSVEFVDGRKDDPYDFSTVTATNSTQTCTNILKSSIRRTFDLSWHNSSLCCTATQDQITTSTCKKLYIVPADYCMGKEDKTYDHPYDDCYLFIQCASNRTHINTCGENIGLCFSETTGGCTDAIATKTDPNFVDDPYSCEGKPNPSYIPVDGSCSKSYGWCVNKVKHLHACTGDTYFNGSGPPEYNLQCASGNCESSLKN